MTNAADVERIVRRTLDIVDRETPLSVGEPLVQRVLSEIDPDRVQTYHDDHAHDAADGADGRDAHAS